jgi:predicted dehydrogenase
LFDLAVYGVTSLTGLLGPARRVMAMAGIAIPEREVDGELMKVEIEDNVQFLIDFGESLFASVATGFTMQQYRSPAFELYGSEGTIQLMGDDWGPAGYELWQNKVGAWQIFPETAAGWRWTDGLRHFVECIHQDVPPIITPEHAFHVLEILIKAHESGRDEQVKYLESMFTPPSFEEGAEWTPPHLIHDRTRDE